MKQLVSGSDSVMRKLKTCSKSDNGKKEDFSSEQVVSEGKRVIVRNPSREPLFHVADKITDVVSINTGRKQRKNDRKSNNGWEVTDSPVTLKSGNRSLASSTENTSNLRKRKLYVDATSALDGEGIISDLTKKESDENNSTNVDTLVTEEEVENAVKALFQLIKITAEKRGPSLFESEAKSVHMQINSIHIPRTPTRRIRFSLPFSMMTDTSDVCLFVPDLKKGARIDHEPTVTYYQELLDRHGIKGITQIIPVRQLKDDYFQYEMRRRLCASFDMFLADGRICGPIIPLLGKEFHIKRKLPTPVNLHTKNLKEAIQKALSKTALTVTPHGVSTLVKVGHSQQSVQQLTENIMSVIEQMKKLFPGGWQNIRSLNLKTSQSLTIPFYVTMKSANNVKVPVVKPLRPRAALPVEDELSTLPGTRVTIMPTGEIIVKKDADLLDSNSEIDSEEVLEEGEEEDGQIKKRDKKEKTRVKNKLELKPSPEANDSDSGVEAAEDEYLSGWMQEILESEEPSKKKAKRHKVSAKHAKKTEVGKPHNAVKLSTKGKKVEKNKKAKDKKNSKNRAKKLLKSAS